MADKHIAVDASEIEEINKSGRATFSLNLLRSLGRIDTANRYSVFTVYDADKGALQNPNFNIKSLPRALQALTPFIALLSWYSWYFTGLSLQLKRVNPDVFFSLSPSLPPGCPHPAVCIIYDLTPISLSDAHRLDFKVRFRLQATDAVKRSDRIITISQAAKNEIVSYFGVSSDKISIVYPGFDSSLFKPEQDSDKIKLTLDKYAITSPYLLYVGTLEPKKNIIRLIEAFCRLKKEKGIDHKLVIAGKRAWKDSGIFDKIRMSGCESDIVFTDYVPQAELPALISGADVFVFPSLHEGFGMPPLEAMACGTPVVVSITSSLPEVVGDAGITVDPYDVENIAEAIYRVISDRDLNKQMRKKGLERARLFSWEKAAGETLTILENTLNKFRPGRKQKA
jgi:glycosyltransferase involved in cell wall biosynthesis